MLGHPMIHHPRRPMPFDKVLVTGGSGLLGRYVVRELKAHGHGVTVLDVKPPEAGVPFIQADILDLASVTKAVKGQDAVVHLAALDLAIQTTQDHFMRVNVQGTWHVLQAAEAAGIAKVVLTSSVAATGLGEMRTDWPPQYLPVDENHPMRPVHAYSVSKQIVEDLGASFVRRSAMSVICLRPLLVMFPDTIPKVVERSRGGHRWLYYYVTSEDTARAFRLALETTDVRYAACLVGAADNCVEEPTFDMLRRNRIEPFPEVRAPALYRKFPRASVLDTEHAKRILGYEPTSDWLKLSAAARAAPRPATGGAHDVL
jgi:nucleoside-diphosphate-sugar epimerase